MILSFLVRKIGGAFGIRPGIRRVIETVVNSGIVVLLGFATGVLAARMLGPTGRGELASILLPMQMAAQLSIIGLPSATIYHLKQRPDRRSELTGAVLILAIGMGLAVALAGVAIIPWWLDEYRPRIVLAAQTAVMLAPLWALMQISTPILRGRDEFRIFNGVRVITPAATALALATMLFVFDNHSSIWVAVPYALSTSIFMFWPLSWIWRDCRPRIRGTAESIRTLLRYGGRSVAVDLVNTINRFLDRIVLVYLLAPSAVGLYVVAVSMARPLTETGLAITFVLFPKASGAEPQQAIEISSLAGRVGLWVMAALALPLLVVAPLLLHLVFGEAFVPAVPVFRIILVSVVLTATGDILSQALMATGRPGTVSILRCFEAAVLGVLLAALVPPFGMNGAAWAVFAASAVRFIGIIVCYPLVLHRPPPRLYINAADLRRVRSSRQAAPVSPG
jgi:O-antigen/teichoic acid export membrane protein